MADRGPLINLKWWLGGYDLSGRFNTGGLVTTCEDQDATAFSANTRIGIPGLPKTRAEFGGFVGFGAGEPDDVFAAIQRLEDQVLSVSPQTGAEGDRVYAFLAALASYQPRGRVGERFEFAGSAFATGAPLIPGTLLHHATRNASGDGTALQVGAVLSGQQLYAWLHVLAITGTLDVLVQSDTSGFPSPTTRVTFAQAAAIGAQWALPVAGPITNDFWRASWTLSGGGSALFVVGIGIL